MYNNTPTEKVAPAYMSVASPVQAKCGLQSIRAIIVIGLVFLGGFFLGAYVMEDDIPKEFRRLNDISPDVKVFIDLGANCGNSYLKQIQDGIIDSTYKAYLWEANPVLVARYLRLLARKYENVKVIPYAATTQNRNLEFHLTKGQDGVNPDFHSHNARCDPQAGGNPSGASSLLNTPRAGRSISVRGVNFAEWIRHSVLPTNYIVLKIDIEGSEYEILAQMIEENLVCWVNEYYIEFHHWKIGLDSSVKHKFEQTIASQCPETMIHSWH